MNPIFNTKDKFYDYFPHLPAIRMKKDFGLGFYEQSAVRNEVQKAIRQAYDRLVASHDLVHVNVYGEIGEEFDHKFYNELKTNVNRHFHAERSWSFLDGIMHEPIMEDPKESAHLNLKMLSATGNGMQRDTRGRVNLKEAFIKLFNHDLDQLNGRELLYLTKIK